ncbi:hypothetical protein FW774_04210 (plasmid) [Pedobacter sp. BS3]|uniref:hypothetical protein n=1 Tax=Pedobacter sp. BS3 TaxID=2567937 RepID=UPI0011EBEC52|nr:hypothetical protein [Pedobacter sp. BS3]TZF86258.1 hypothetical protein FW774_04210 [Pedobacter sp. BS3]
MIGKIDRKVGFVSFGEVNSPKKLIAEMSDKALRGIHSLGYQIVTTGLVTDDERGEDVLRAQEELAQEKFDVLIICLSGWIPSHTVISITDKYRHLPIVLWGLAGEKPNGHIVTTAAQAGTSALRKVFQDLGYKFIYLYNIIGSPSPLSKIESFITAAFAGKNLRDSRIGMMGFRDMRLYNTLYEGISLKKNLGIEVEFFEMLEVVSLSEKINADEVQVVLDKIKSAWEFLGEMDKDFLKRGITYYLAIKQIADERGLDAISLKDVDGMKKILGFPPAFVFMLLADEAGFCTIPENDVMGAVTQLVVKQLTGQCAAYLEFYEYFEDSVLMGVPDYVPQEVVEGGIRVLPAAFGQISGGLLNVSAMKEGGLTIARISNTGSDYTMHIAYGQGERCSWEEAGWTQPAPQLPSLLVKLETPVEQFVKHISGQHYILAYGDYRNQFVDFCELNDIAVVLH